MKIIINGKETEEQEGMTIKELLEKTGLDATRVAVELNAAIVKRADYPETGLKEGDKLEIVHFVGGG